MDTEPFIKEETNIYSTLRDDIVKLRLRPGMFFNIKDICTLYEVGRSPGREALLQLEQEELITVLPHRGSIVSRLDLDRIDNERFIHRSIEENVLRDFIGMFSPSVILRMENCILEQKEQFRIKDVRRFFHADEEFHALFYSEIFRDYCLSVVERECSNYKRMRLLILMADDNFMKNSIEEHESMVGAVSTRNLDKLMFWSSLHTDRYKARERWLLKRFPDLFTQPEEGIAEMHKSPSDLTSDFLLSIRSRGL